MKKLILPILFSLVVPTTFSCGSSRLVYNLNQVDAASALRQMLEIGARESLTGAFSHDQVMTTLFPGELGKTLNSLQQLGLITELDRFTNTVSSASEKSAERSIPIFVRAIDNMSFTDAIRIIKDGGTSGTDYLKTATGSEIRTAIKPVVQDALNEYKLNEQWDKIMKPAQTATKNRINLDLSNLVAGLVTEKMYQKIAEKEIQIRSDASARTTPLLQKVFSRSW
ncbi:MAG: DUF4197 domain-containing protein [Flavisolibacter sp.]